MTVFTLKITGIILMTLDHLDIAFSGAPQFFHYLGRAAAPIFCFALAQGLRHTHDRRRYLLRLYLASLAMEMLNMLFHWLWHVSISNNIFYSWFLSAGVIVLYEIWKKEPKKGKRLTAGVLFVQCFHLGLFVINQVSSGVLFKTTVWLSDRLYNRIGGILTLVPSCEGGLIWILLTVLFYRAGDSKRRLIQGYLSYWILYTLLICTNLSIRIRHMADALNLDIFRSAAEYFFAVFGCPYFPKSHVYWKLTWYGWMIIFALPILLLYNGKQGRRWKCFFYLYYPLHLYVLCFLSL